MTIEWSSTQLRRLKELNGSADLLSKSFDSTAERNHAFQKVEGKLKRDAKKRLEDIKAGPRRPRLCVLEQILTSELITAGFVQVTTPIIMSRAHLAKMSITEQHPLHSQVFWLDDKRCLRPMLAPHLYYLLKDLLRLWERPVRIFEVGPCFRKETHGAQHANEFTMLNLVEMGLPAQDRHDRLEEMAQRVMAAAGIEDYRLVTESSDVYGDTIDVEAGLEGLEVASGAMGPHALDEAWRITDTWVGLGFGLERLLMISEGIDSLGKMGRSLSYLDGNRLNI